MCVNMCWKEKQKPLGSYLITQFYNSWKKEESIQYGNNCEAQYKPQHTVISTFLETTNKMHDTRLWHGLQQPLTLLEACFISWASDAEQDHKGHASHNDHWNQDGCQLIAGCVYEKHCCHTCASVWPYLGTAMLTSSSHDNSHLQCVCL